MVPSSSPAPRKSAAARRRERTQEIIAATRALFDARGVRDAQIEDIARAVGINRAIVYRHFTGKEELFALTLVTYLDELHEALTAVDDASHPPVERLAAVVGAFVDYGVAHPAFVDCAQALMRRTGTELLDEVNEEVALRLGRAMARPLGLLASILEEGRARDEFHLDSPETVANLLYATGLGTLQLARVGLAVEPSSDLPVVRAITSAQARDYLVHSAVAFATHRVPAT